VDNPPIETLLGAAKAYNLAKQYNKALKETANVLQRDPNQTAAARALRAEARLGQGKLDDALVEIRQSVTREKQSAYLIILGEVHFARKEYADAIDAYRDALRLDPKRIDVRFRRAVLMVRGGRVRDGIRQLKKVIKAGHNLAQAQLFLGIGYSETGKEATALAAFRSAVAKDPKLGEAHNRMGLILWDTKKLEAAYTAFKRATTHATDEDFWRPQAWYNLGVVAQLLGRKKASIEALIKYLGIARPGARLKKDAMKQLLKQGWRPPQHDDDD
jgi:tetratricopeptide (TPR) repeat protein